MRTVDPAERTLLGGQALSHHVRVEVENEDGTWIDLTAYVVGSRTLSFLDTLTITESIDAPTASCSVTFKSGHGALSLHPLRSDSLLNRNDAAAYAPLLHGGSGLRVSVGAGLPDADGPAYGWHPVFIGIIDDPDATDETKRISVSARDLGARLLDRIIEDELTSYQTDDGTDLEVVLAMILADNSAGLPVSVTIALPNGSPGWVVVKDTASRVSVLERMRTMAQQIGWDVRYRWNGDTPELQLYDPDRTKTVADFTLPPSEYLGIERLKFGDTGVRNVVKVKFIDRTAGNINRAITVQDDSSIAIYGRRYIEFSEGETSNIDTPDEALDMAQAALSDLATPFVDHVVRSFDLWFAELGDLIEFPANDASDGPYDDDQKFAIVEITRTWQNGHGLVRFRTRGKPAGAYNDWIRKAGRGPDGFPLPAPYVGPVYGEFSEGGGISGDGSLSFELGFEPNTQNVKVFVEERADLPVPVPEVSAITQAWDLHRPPGRFQENSRNPSFAGLVKPPKGSLNPPYFQRPTNAPDWRTIVQMATRPGWFKRVRVIGYNWQGAAGPEHIADAVQAVDPVPIVDGVVTALTVTPGDRLFTVVVDVGTLDPNYPSKLCIMRNGLVIRPLFIGFQAGSAWTFIDDKLDTALPYTYEAYIWTEGVTGAHVVTESTGQPGPAPPAPPAADTIEWVDPTPDLVNYRGLNQVRATWVHNAAWATKVRLQYSADGTSGWIDRSIRLVAPSTGTAYYQPALPGWYRFIAANDDDSQTATSASRQFMVASPPSPPSAILRFVNGSPRLNAAGDAVLLDYQCTVVGADHVVLMRSTDLVNWTDLDDSTDLVGQFVDSDLTPGYFMLRAEDASDVELQVSAVATWNGGSSLPAVLDAPPIITAVPDVILDASVPKLRVQYDSNISWFAVMQLEVSADGVGNWSVVDTDTDPADAFLYANTQAQWVRVAAVDSVGSRRLASAVVYFPGVGAGGSGTSTTAPTFTESVQTIGGIPRLVIEWLCANPNAVRVTIEKSADGVTGFTEIAESAAVAAGQWSLGDPLEEAYYRMKAYDAGAVLLATSAVRYWPGQLFQA